MSEQNDTVFDDLIDEVADRIRADSELSTITVATDHDDDMATVIIDALGSENSTTGPVGLCIAVMSPLLQCSSKNLPGPVFEDVMAVRVLENREANKSTNGFNKRPLAVARRVARVLHLYTPHGLSTPLFCDQNAVQAVEDPISPLVYEVRIRTTPKEAAIQKAASPTVSVSSEFAITISSADSGAQIYYSLDGSLPRSGNANAILYTEEFTLTESATVRVASYVSGKIASDTIQKEIIV